MKKLVYYAVMLAFLMPMGAHAQVGVFGGSAQKIPTIQFERDNQYMADLLSLQNQVSLLGKMVDRQKELNKMADNLAQLHMPFVPPPPEYEVCEQLPSNDLCATFFPDLYDDYVAAALMPEPLTVPDLPSVAINKMPVKTINELDESDVQKLEKSEFMWAEINCLNEECKAIVVPDMKGNTSRYTIHVGDRLPNGLVVESISVDGVVTSRGSKPVSLQPAPSSVAPQKSIS